MISPACKDKRTCYMKCHNVCINILDNVWTFTCRESSSGLSAVNWNRALALLTPASLLCWLLCRDWPGRQGKYVCAKLLIGEECYQWTTTGNHPSLSILIHNKHLPLSKCRILAPQFFKLRFSIPTYGYTEYGFLKARLVSTDSGQQSCKVNV